MPKNLLAKALKEVKNIPKSKPYRGQTGTNGSILGACPEPATISSFGYATDVDRTWVPDREANVQERGVDMAHMRQINHREKSEKKLGRSCPYCSSDVAPKVFDDAPIPKRGEMWRKAQCPKCNGKWFIVYEFKSINSFQW